MENYDDLGKTIKIEQPKINQKDINGTTDQKKTDTVHTVTTVIFAALTICLLITTIFLSKKCVNQIDNQELLQEQIAEQKATIDQQTEEIALIKTTVDDLTQGSTETISDQNTEDLTSVMYFESYTVQAGDSLFSICNKAGIDYYSTYQMILAVNGINNPDELYEGQTIMLPVEQ